MTILAETEQFLYTYPVQHHKRELLKLIATGEAAYIRAIVDLTARVKQLEDGVEASCTRLHVDALDSRRIANVASDYGDHSD